MLFSAVFLINFVVGSTHGHLPVKIEPGDSSDPGQASGLEDPWAQWAAAYRLFYTPIVYPIEQRQAYERLTLMYATEMTTRFIELENSTNRPSELGQFLRLEQEFMMQELHLKGSERDEMTEYFEFVQCP